MKSSFFEKGQARGNVTSLSVVLGQNSCAQQRIGALCVSELTAKLFVDHHSAASEETLVSVNLGISAPCRHFLTVHSP